MTQPLPPANPENEQRLNAMIAEYLKRKDAGQHVNKDAMLKAYPDLAEGLRSYFQGEAMMDDGAAAFAATKLSPIPLASDVRETIRPGEVQSDTASEFKSRKFGRYQILRPLGEGAMGSVYLALDTTLDRQVALKVPKSEGTANAEFMARFTREAKAAASLKHPNICSVYDTGEHEGTAYITMDFIDGVPLSRFIGSQKLQSVDSILHMIMIIADAIGHAHSKGVIHRDLKPGNILVDSNFKPHVTDFGLARRAGGPADESRITQEGLLIGTPAYMAPEQVKGEQSKVGPQSDIYSLGVILFELLTCRLPFEGKIPEMLAKVLRDTPPVPSRVRKNLTEDVDDLCLKMLQKEPERRFASIQDVVLRIVELRKKLRQVAVPAAKVTAQQQSPFDIQKAHIELMLKKGQYAAAIQDLEKLAQQTLPGAKAAADWAKAKLPTVKKEAKALSPAGLEALLNTAQQMFQKSDYIGCTQLIEEIPPLRRTEPMEDLLVKAKRREAEAEQLLLDIKDREHRQDIDGLEPLVRKLLKLKAGNAYAKRLLEALQTYSRTPPTRRKYRYEKDRLQPMPEPGFLRQWAVLGSLVGVLTFLSVYGYVIFYLKNGNQTLAVHVDDEWLKSQGGEVTLVVDGNNHTITAPSSGGDPVTVTVSLGQHTFSVKHGDTIVHDPKSFEIEKDGRRVLSITPTDVRLENGVPAHRPDSELAASNNNRRVAVPEPEKQATDKVDWIPLFDGSDVSRWSSLGPYRVQDGLLIANNGQSKSAAVSREEYADFELDAEWRIGARANGGIYYRELATTPWLGNEYQLIDPAHPNGEKAIHKTGALYGFIAPSEDVERPVGEWNTTRIVCRGSVAEHWLNGKKVVEYDTAGPEWQDLKNRSEIKTGKERIGTQSQGHILLQSQTGDIAFRSIRVRTVGADIANALPQVSSSPPPLAIAPFDAVQAKQYQDTWAAHLGQPVEYANSIGMTLRLLPPGEFSMGSPDGEKAREQGEGPLHRVRLTQPFYMGMTEVTQSQWFAVMGTRPWMGDEFVTEGENYPVSFVNWHEGSDFCQKLSGIEGVVYRYPTEAEWEYACRAGSSTIYSNTDDSEQLASIGNVADAVAVAKFPEWNWAIAASDGYATTSPVGQFKLNNFGLADMHGNVSEFCQDMFDVSAYSAQQGVTIDPLVLSGPDRHVARGGSAFDSPGWARAAARNASGSNFRNWTFGFRVVREIKKADKVSTPLPAAHLQESEIPDPNSSLKIISQVHGATADALVAWAKALPAGYRPYWLSVRANTKPILYDALATKTADQSEWIMQFYDHADETNWAEMKLQYRPALLNVYAKDDIYERLVLWDKSNQQYEYWLGSQGFMEEKLNEGLKWDQGAKLNRERWLPTSVVGHWFDGGPTYDMLMAWLPYHQCEWALDVPLDELPALVEKYRTKGWQPANLNIINGSTPARCSAVFGDNPEKRKWTFSPALSVNEYRLMLIKVDADGGQPQCVFSRMENEEIVYTVLWHGVEL